VASRAHANNEKNEKFETFKDSKRQERNGKAGPSIHVQYLVLTTRGTFGDRFCRPQPDESEPDVARGVTAPLADFPFLSYFAESHCNGCIVSYAKTSLENRITNHRKTESHAAPAQKCRRMSSTPPRVT
jgi:hypothetical protein